MKIIKLVVTALASFFFVCCNESKNANKSIDIEQSKSKEDEVLIQKKIDSAASFIFQEKKKLYQIRAKNIIQVQDPKLVVATAKNWIHSYQTNPLYYNDPTSFVMNTASLRTYLNNYPDIDALHIYLNYNNKDLKNGLDFAIIGLDTVTMTHIYSNISNKTVFGNCVSCPSFCYTNYDSLDSRPPTYHNFPPISDNSILPALSAKKYIDTFQAINLYNHTTNLPSFSFIIDAIQLKAFLTQSLLQSPATGIVPYLQLYLAYKNNNQDSVTLILVGVNSLGNHVYYKQGTTNYVFEQCVPCPQCNTTPDPDLDGRIQQILEE